MEIIIESFTVNIYNYGCFKGIVKLSTFTRAVKIFYPEQFMAFNIKGCETMNDN